MIKKVILNSLDENPKVPSYTFSTLFPHDSMGFAPSNGKFVVYIQ
jgi:hypothetical protein